MLIRLQNPTLLRTRLLCTTMTHMSVQALKFWPLMLPELDCIVKDGGISTNLWNDKLQKFHNQARNLMTGLKYHMTRTSNSNSNSLNGKSKSDLPRNNFPRTSTLMKPTASQLAKQNHSYQGGASRFQMPFGQNNNKSSCNPSRVELQAAKRQKLDGGHLPKHLADVKQQTSLVHKAPRKNGPLDGNFTHGRMKLTIPREPDLETAQRAQRARPNNRTEEEEVKSVARKFKARPLNRKILEVPSLLLPEKSTPRLPEFQVFHLKTSERAMQHTAAHSSSSLHCFFHWRSFFYPNWMDDNNICFVIYIPCHY